MAEAALDQIAATCVALGVATDTLSVVERAVIPKIGTPTLDIPAVRASILQGDDPLGQAFCVARNAEDRRLFGQIFTPRHIVQAMLSWAGDRASPERVVDPGCGSGRYVLSALLAFPGARGVAVDVDPYATLMARANALVLGVADRLDVRLQDYRSLELPEITGATLYLGNPPYVRHHDIDARWKRWLGETATDLGLKASKLAGLHAHFFLATALYARPGDFGAFITSSEWLDVNYGQLIRDLLTGRLSVSSLHIVNPASLPFEDATVTGAITCFAVGQKTPEVRIQEVDDITRLGSLSGGFPVSRKRLAEANRWSVITRVAPRLPDGYVELGELARVHRGAVTGANKVWVVPAGTVNLPDEVLFPTVTKARELFAAGRRLASTAALKMVIDLPKDLDVFDSDKRELVDRFLHLARKQGAASGYVARNRRAWWSVGLTPSAPILTTYMARRPPAFVCNTVEARHINIAHGIYPRDTMTAADLDRLAAYLRASVSTTSGRTYAGGLTKFEPREMERLIVPGIDLLRERRWNDEAGAVPALVSG